MSLQSQMPRAGGSRRYMSSRGRSRSKLPWIALILLAAGVVGLYFYFNDDGTAPEPAQASPVGSPATGSTGVTPVGGSTDRPRPGAQPGSASAATPRQADPEHRPVRQPDLTVYAQQNDPPLEGQTKDQYELGLQKLEEGDLVTGRALLSELLFRPGALPRHEAQAVRERLAFENQKLVFSREAVPNDTITLGHTVQSGEYLSTIANTYKTPYQFLERINNLDARNLQAGQTIKVLRGPIHAQVDKSDYRMDLYVEDPNGLKVYLCSFPVGLGETDSTPIGTWRIAKGSKVGPENGGPSWRNPRTGEVYDRDDPDIPIGEYWMALEGMDENTREKRGYGIHATNEPESIGQQASMGCIRMRDEDVDRVFYMLYEVRSRVEIVP